MKHRIAILGIGAATKMHATALAELDNGELVAGSCRTEEKGKAFAAEHDVQWFVDYEKMLDVIKPDVVCLGTPSGAHLEPALACFERGIHVLTEKPLEITLERADLMINAAAQAKVQLGGIFQYRYNPVMRAVRDAAAAGRFGNVAMVNTYVPWWRGDDYYGGGRWQGTKALDGGGAIINQTSHMIDAMQWIAAATMKLGPDENPVEEVFAYTALRGHDPEDVEVEDIGVAVVRYRSGALGQILGATAAYPGCHRRVQIAGRHGTAEIVEDQLTTFQFRDEQPEDETIRRTFDVQAESHGGAGDPMAFSHVGHRENIRAFLQAIEEDREPDIPGREGRKAIQIIEAIYESARTGGPVRIP